MRGLLAVLDGGGKGSRTPTIAFPGGSLPSFEAVGRERKPPTSPPLGQAHTCLDLVCKLNINFIEFHYFCLRITAPELDKLLIRQ